MDIGPLREIVILILALTGTLFMLLSGLGMIRLPDVFARMHAADMASTVGITSLLLAAGVTFYHQDRLPTMIALIVLFFVTAPVATTTMARAAHRVAADGLEGEDGQEAEKDFHLRIDDLAGATKTGHAQSSTQPHPTHA